MSYPSAYRKQILDEITQDRDNLRESLKNAWANIAALRAENVQLKDRVSELQAEFGYTDSIATLKTERMREALDQAEAVLSIVEPRTSKAEYLRVLGVVRAAISCQ